MYNAKTKNLVLIAILMAFSISAVAQVDTATTFTSSTTTTTTTTSVRPFTGSKGLRKFSIGINAGALNPAVAIGGSNNFTNPQTTLGYGANLKYQLTHWLAAQADFVRGDLKGDNENRLWDDPSAPPANRPIYAFQTELHYAISGGAVFTLGNINWLKAESKIVPYISAGAGLANWDVRIDPVPAGPTPPNVDYSTDGINEFFVPV